MLEAYFEAQQLCFCIFLLWGGVEGQMCGDVQLLMYKNFNFVGFGFLKVQEVKCVLMLKGWYIF